jgi:hypothetical protein
MSPKQIRQDYEDAGLSRKSNTEAAIGILGTKPNCYGHLSRPQA